ncbi:hypothetical protein DWB61_07890 [Ancylomarina euxinus]|uniref:Uncharacterized protein n=1 Tax=Ancylomarina euxinus TaxID=2283627 RepID=A0A425Y2A2_9BACT|nr:hypothetical protein [Ancylomarina euxinus]MCZ4694907.1 hypothetical protein [Ancylomarina euxinus]MUP14773.1 hypothetical protein [Ancylomarina euxinus]RRG22119.1 hypothetical protein DWB61_07890 [Ancylomarina euxinus]
MEIFINHNKVSTFKGARLCDALMSYSKETYKLLIEKEIWLEDERGNPMDADGRLWDGIQLFIKLKAK